MDKSYVFTAKTQFCQPIARISGFFHIYSGEAVVRNSYQSNATQSSSNPSTTAAENVIKQSYLVLLQSLGL
jgi:hypothetical protein